MYFKDYKSFKKINYSIYNFSSCSSTYKPENIMNEDNLNPSSRWSTSSTSLDQYIILKISAPCIVTSIIFGKYCKVHVCNVKELKVYAEFQNKEICILSTTLKNDNEKEIFNLVYSTENKYIITQYIKISPFSSWGMNFNYSLWYVELRGYDIINYFLDYNKIFSFYLSSRLILNFLNKHNALVNEVNEVFNSHMKVELESEIAKKIKVLIRNEKFDELENFLEKNFLCFEEFCEEMPYTANWEEIENRIVSPRGGHQMVHYKNNLLIYGGWDGQNELGDMYLYKINDRKFEKIDLKNTPGLRSCHKMINVNEKVYLFGKYIPIEYSRQNNWIEREFFVFDNIWHHHNFYDGPANLFDHQMVGFTTQADQKMPNFYIFGGRMQNDHHYSGLYLMENCIMTEIRGFTSQPTNTVELKGRVGHSLVLIPEKYFHENENFNVLKDLAFFNDSLVIIGGQRGKDSFKEITFYSINTDTVYFNVPYPFNCDGKIAQRAVLRGHELIIYFSFSKEKEKMTESFLYIYNLKLRKWIKVTENIKPMPRSAHTFVDLNNVIYLFGGNCGNSTKRNQDFWQLTFKKSTSIEVVNELKFLIRRHIYLRIKNKKEALIFLKTKIHPLVTDSLVKKYKMLCCEMIRGVKEDISELERCILSYLPKDMCEERSCIEDLTF